MEKGMTTASALTEYYKFKDKILQMVQGLMNLQYKECSTHIQMLGKNGQV